MDPTLDLQPLWLLPPGDSGSLPALEDPWGGVHRPDWAARGLIIWPRGGQWRRLRLTLVCPQPWRSLGPAKAVARLCLRWWAEAMALHVDGEPIHGGDLFDTACRWPLPARWWSGEAVELEVNLRSPRHDDGALIHSRVELEPLDARDPDGLLAPSLEALAALRRQRGWATGIPSGTVQVLGHAHLDLAWLWPVADTWRAAERTFVSTLDLMERFPQLHFGHSTPALYAWLEMQRPALFERIRSAMRAGRWEPLNGPWVENDCVLIDTASLLRQFQEGQHYSRRTFPEWEHHLAWLPDSFGFAAGLPAVAAATGVSWFCTHKLAWNATNPFPHRLFRWRSRCGSEVLALMTAPIGTDGDPLPIETYRLDWQRATGIEDALWLPGVGDHGGGPTAEMLEQLALWQQQPQAVPQRHGTLRAYLERLEPLAPQLPVWRDELYLELHRGCATSRPDQKRHNRSLERLLREADLARALLLSLGRGGSAGVAAGVAGAATAPDRSGSGRPATLERPAAIAGARDDVGPTAMTFVSSGGCQAADGELLPGVGRAAGPGRRDGETRTVAAGPDAAGGPLDRAASADDDGASDWRPLLFQQFHDILPGTSIPEVFEQAEPQWRAARRRSCRQRDRDLQALLAGAENAAIALSAPWSPATGPEPAAGSTAHREGFSASRGVNPPGQAPPPVASAAPQQPLEPNRAGGGLLNQRSGQECSAAAPDGKLHPPGDQLWWLVQLQALPAAGQTLRLPAGRWNLIQADGQESALPAQTAAEGGVWIQLPVPAGVAALALRRRPATAADLALTSPETLPPGRFRTLAPPLEPLQPRPAAQPGQTRQPTPTAALPPPSMRPLAATQPHQPVHLIAPEELGASHWRLGNGLIEAVIGPAGLEQLLTGPAAGGGESLLAAPLRWQRWADRGEFWDAWDLAADHRRHPLPWTWQGTPELVSAGPLAVQFRWRGCVGESPVRLELRLLAGSPWLELVLSQQWRQRHELLQLEIPLGRQAERWAADTSAGVIERPAVAQTPREQARWEVPTISWAAAAGLAVLLDGPQGVSATADRLSVSLLRAPTWPDPGADNGWQRQRLGLMAAPAGWRPARVPQQARRLREPLWLRPRQPPANRSSPPPGAPPELSGAQPAGQRMPARPFLPPLQDDLRLLALRPAKACFAPTSAADGGGEANGAEAMARDQSEGDPFSSAEDHAGVDLVLSVQNEGPCRRRLELGPNWQVLERLDGLDRPWTSGGDRLELAPWQLAFWRLRWRPVPA